jgi:hypothetical protein
MIKMIIKRSPNDQQMGSLVALPHDSKTDSLYSGMKREA